MLPKILKTYKLSKKSSGFTLVELLVVVAIIAILATISVTVFSAAQGGARDGKRRSEINSIAKSIESAKDYGATTQVYKYDSTLSGNDFPRGVPEDPVTTQKYCIAVSTSSTPIADATTWADTDTCPTAPAGYITFASAITALAGDDLQDGTAKSWNICAKLERSSTRFCVKSLTK